ncbi:class V chitinase CHIT5-like [Camellia sinensis]|uniref:class V chitinase CHIT5-like n=1 Tax=Camellia sinensis TaxID=4442 RepID=UPI001036A58D|nr:class V chitinase CHIT5-like [Camellia sinensis]
MGLPMYGRTWKLKDPNQNGMGAPANGTGPGYLRVMKYSDIVDFNLANNASVVFDEETVSTYSYAGTDWIGYDDMESISNKVNFARANGLGGYFFWAVGFDKNWTISEAASMAWDYQS